MIKHKHFLFMLVVLSCAVRLFFFLLFLKDNPCLLLFDSGHYHTAALHLAQGQGFVGADGLPYFYRLPGYPLFLALCYTLFNFNVLCTLIAQMVLASFIPLCVFFLSLKLFPDDMRCAKAAALITALHPGFLILSGLLMSETLFILLFLLFFLVLLPNCFFSAGVLLGLATLIRPVGLPLILLACIVTFIVKRNYFFSLTLFAGWAAIVGTWLLRNFLLTGSIFLHTLSGPHLLNHGAVRVTMAAQHISYQQAKQQMQQQFESMQRSVAPTEIEHSRLAEKLALQTMLKQPIQTIKLCINNVIKTIFSLYSSELLVIDSGGQLPTYDQRSVKDMLSRFLLPHLTNTKIIFVIYLEILLHLLLLIGALGFFLSALITKNFLPQALIMGAFIILFLALSCFCGFARLRLPVEFFLIIMATRFWIANCPFFIYVKH